MTNTQLEIEGNTMRKATTEEEQYKISNKINNNRSPKMMKIIEAIKKLIEYIFSYCYPL